MRTHTILAMLMLCLVGALCIGCDTDMSGTDCEDPRRYLVIEKQTFQDELSVAIETTEWASPASFSLYDDSPSVDNIVLEEGMLFHITLKQNAYTWDYSTSVAKISFREVDTYPEPSCNTKYWLEWQLEDTDPEQGPSHSWTGIEYRVEQRATFELVRAPP